MYIAVGELVFIEVGCFVKELDIIVNIVLVGTDVGGILFTGVGLLENIAFQSN